MNDQWKKLLEESRNNYLSIVQSVSKMQKEIEKIILYTTENNMNYQQDLSGLLANWVNMGNDIREEFKKIFEANLKTTFDTLAGNLPFKDELEKLYTNIQQSFYKYFENLEKLNFMNKK